MKRCYPSLLTLLTFQRKEVFKEKMMAIYEEEARARILERMQEEAAADKQEH